MVRFPIATLLATLCTAITANLSAVEWAPSNIITQHRHGWRLEHPWQSDTPAEPQLVMGEHQNAADVYAWTNEGGLQFSIVVHDDGFNPGKNDRWVWRSDCLYIEIDGHGDNPETHMASAQTMLICFLR